MALFGGASFPSDPITLRPRPSPDILQKPRLRSRESSEETSETTSPNRALPAILSCVAALGACLRTITHRLVVGD